MPRRRPSLRLMAMGAIWASPASAQYVPPPFSEAVRSGDMLYLSGQIGVAPGTTVPVVGGIPAEAGQALDNIGRTLARHGLGFGDVVRCLVMLTDMGRWADFNRVYAGYFPPGRLPARSAMGVTALALGAQVEIECTARFPTRSISPGGAFGPYSQAVAANGQLFISGVIPFDAEKRRFATRDIPAQMRQALRNLEAVLAASGVTRRDIVRTTVYLRYPADKPAMDAAYAEWFGNEALPARTAVPGVDWGRDDLLVEIDAIASLPEVRK